MAKKIDKESPEYFNKVVKPQLAANFAAPWAIDNNINLGNFQFKLAGHEYQFDWLNDQSKRQCFIKGAQLGATQVQVLRTLHGMIHHKYPAGAMYLFPTGDDVSDFSKGRFNPLIDFNDCIKAFVRNTDATNIKQINGAFLVLRGARSTREHGGVKKTSTKLKTFPADLLVCDERDEMEDDMVELAQARLLHSDVREEVYLSTPTIPGQGIDQLYKDSDQRIWLIKCEKCGAETCLELEFPDCLLELSDGRVIRACKKCKSEIHPRDGQWVAQYPDKAEQMVGWWISQLNYIGTDPKIILSKYRNPPNGNLSEVMNSLLGMAYIPAENKLNQNDVWACMGNDPMLVNHDGPCCMGVDVGSKLNVVIAVKTNERALKILRVAEVGSFNDVHDLAKRFNVKCAVFDLYPETRRVREFIQSEPFEVFGCVYRETQVGGAKFDDNENIVAVNRTEICDATHDLFMSPGKIEIPRKCSEMETFVKQVCNMAKVLTKNEKTGHKEFRYQGLGGRSPDHYRHAVNYCWLAAQRIGTVSDSWVLNNFLTRKVRGFMAA